MNLQKSSFLFYFFIMPLLISNYLGASESVDVTVTSSLGLSSLLSEFDIDFNKWGPVKNVVDLFNEIQNNDSTLVRGEDTIYRQVSPLFIIIRDENGRFLMEEKQVFTGTNKERIRNILLGEKIVSGETLEEAIARALKEELTGYAKNPVIIEGSHEVVIETTDSFSYPGLKAVYNKHFVEVKVEGLPKDSFQTIEKDKINFWTWVDKESIKSPKEFKTLKYYNHL